MKVSVISTVYNGEKHFDKALPSILAQTYEDFEYIIVDDGSSDRTLELLNDASSKDTRIKIYSPGRLGRSKALNYALSKANGKYIFQQDFDDFSCPDRIVKQLRILEENNVDVVGSYYLVDDEIKNELFERKPPLKSEDIVRAFSKYIPIAHTLAAFKKDTILDVGGYPDMNDIEDLALWISVARKGGRFYTVPEVLGTHYIYKKSFWASSFSPDLRQKALARVQFRAIKELGLPSWYLLYPLGRLFYYKLPLKLKNTIRSVLGAV